MNWYKIAKDTYDSDQTASVALFRRNNNRFEVLLGQRGKEPSKGQYCLPGGHIMKNEEILTGALRELKEETNVCADSLTFVTKRSREKNNPDTDYVFAAFVPENIEVKAGSDNKITQWTPISALPPVAFDDDKYIIIALAKLFEEELKKKSTSRKRIVTAEILSKDTIAVVKGILDKDKPDKKGLLVVVEGPDGVGKSSQIEKLTKWLEEQKYDVAHTKWNSSELLKDSIKEAKKDRILTPVLYCLLHAADMVVRYENEIVPQLEKNKIVVCDRYIYTSMVRDAIRGIDTTIFDEIYKGFREPDILFNCVAPIEVSFSRLLKGKGLSFYGSGMDMNLATSREENCTKYEKLMKDEYEKIFKDFKGCHRINMNRTIDEIFKEIKTIMGKEFGIGKYKNS